MMALVVEASHVRSREEVGIEDGTRALRKLGDPKFTLQAIGAPHHDLAKPLMENGSRS